MKKRFSYFKSNNFFQIIIMICVILTSIIMIYFTTDLLINKNDILPTNCGNPIFDFDEVEYYHSDFNSFDNILLNKDFNSFNDTINFKDLTKFYEKINIKKEDYSILKNIFCGTKKVNETYNYECLPVYRDVLIFRKKTKIIGFIKICFSCSHYNLIVNNSVKQHNYENNLFLEKFLNLKIKNI